MPPAADPSTRRSAGVFAISLATVVWGAAPLMLKQTSMPPLSFAAYRLWVGVAIYVAVFAVTGRRISAATLLTCAPGGVFFAADVALSFTAFQLTSVANATIIGALAPVCIMLGAARWFGERIARRDLVFVAVSLAGVAAVAIGSARSPSFSAVGDAAAGGSVLSWSAYWLFSKRARASIGALEYMASVMLVAAVVMTVAAAVFPGQGLAPPHAGDWMWIVLVAAFPGAVGHSLVSWSHRHLEAWLGSLITQCQPVVGSLAAWALLGERLTAVTIGGGLAVLAATAAIVARSRGRDASDDAFAEPETPAPAG
jgi:drug/metabolite transporter (DMT)-like permease